MIKMRTNHMQNLEKWAHFVRNNPTKWKKIHTQFINAQFEKAYAFIDKLLKQPNGREKIIKLYKIGNLKGYPNLLRTNQVWNRINRTNRK
ncbi:hypothetical protein HY636_02895 [Candidatus Woesearchaeota archaeon]|nr:hypothetical protein [Candidatus Woesearchaeota archaeon]